MAVPLHPALVHLPLGAALLAPVIAIFAAIALWRGWLGRRAFALVLAVQLVGLAGGGLALRTGEGEGEKVEKRVGEAFVEKHEEAADAFMLVFGASALLTALALVVPGEKRTRYVAAVAAAGTLAAAAAAYRVGKLGGELVYVHGAAAAATSPAPPGGGAGEHDVD